MGCGRVLCVTSNFPRWQGDSTTPFVLNLVKDLSALGWEVDVLAPHAAGAAEIENLEGIRVCRFHYAWPERAETLCYQGGALVNLRKNPINRIKIPFLVFGQLFSMMYLLSGRKYDLIHSHWILPQGFNAALMRGLFSIPHILTVHGGDIFGLQGRLMLPFKKSALNGTDRITVNSSFTEKSVQRILQKDKHLVRIPMGVNTEPLEEKELSQAEGIRIRYKKNEGPLVIFAGRLVEEKGVRDLIHAIGILKPKLKDINLLVVGDGQDKGQFQDLSKSLGLEERVHFTGWVEQKDIKSYIKAGDVFVGPSKTAIDGWVEAQGLTFIEAMAIGVPVIATTNGGIPDAVRDGVTGLLVPENCPGSIAEAIMKLHDDPALQLSLSMKGIDVARSEYSRETCAARFAELFDEVRFHTRGGNT
ncbi:MAG: glycosyltransferase family 4 protein [Chromatiaceae bacterium]|nr:glycosyltransferase family 4 protein [Chromatiaceae bacterium]